MSERSQHRRQKRKETGATSAPVAAPGATRKDPTARPCANCAPSGEAPRPAPAASSPETTPTAAKYLFAFAVEVETENGRPVFMHLLDAVFRMLSITTIDPATARMRAMYTLEKIGPFFPTPESEAAVTRFIHVLFEYPEVRNPVIDVFSKAVASARIMPNDN